MYYPTLTLPLPDGARLRPWQLADAPALVSAANDRAVWRNMRDRFPHPYTAAHARFFLEELATNPDSPELVLAIEADGVAVGSVGLVFKQDVSRRSAEVGYWLGRAAWGRGLATAALQALTEYAFAHHDLARLYALVFAWNPASARVLEKAGYDLEARLRQAITKDGETLDGLLYARLRPA